VVVAAGRDALQVETTAEQTARSPTFDEETSALSQRRRLSIVILPFLNLSQDPNVDNFVDGICDSLITDLSRALPGSFVISRSTAFTYKGRQVAVREIGPELGVRYVLEGSVLAEPRRVRVNVQLIDALTDEHLWSERFDKEHKDILEVQDEIVARLSRSVGIELVRNDEARGIQGGPGGDAIDLIMRARHWRTTSSAGRMRPAQLNCSGRLSSSIPTTLMLWWAFPACAVTR
jgi:TolB-like protein